MIVNQSMQAPTWMKRVLQAAAIYNLAWGLIVIAAPLLLFQWAGMDEPRYPQIWQCVGMIVGVYGIGYWLAAYDPYRHWPIILVGFLGKIFGPIGFLQAATSGDLPWAWGATIITNDLIWWVPFAMILYAAFRVNTDTSRAQPALGYSRAIREIRSHRDASLWEISSRTPTLVVFLRHSGCTFCRASLAELKRHRREIERTGTAIAVVHMGSPMDGTLLLEKYGLDGVHRFSDPHCSLYRAFGLVRGEFRHLFSAGVIARGMKAFWQGHGIGLLHGDGFRMPGAFLIADGQIIEAHRSTTADEAPNYLAMARRAARSWPQSSQTRQVSKTSLVSADS